MRPKKHETTGSGDLFRARLEQIINVKHELVQLAGKIEWQWIDSEIAPLYSDKGRPGIETRFVIGLLLLKHIYGLSDEGVCERWVHDPYFQHFTGEEFFRHELLLRWNASARARPVRPTSSALRHPSSAPMPARPAASSCCMPRRSLETPTTAIPWQPSSRAPRSSQAVRSNAPMLTRATAAMKPQTHAASSSPDRSAASSALLSASYDADPPLKPSSAI